MTRGLHDPFFPMSYHDSFDDQPVTIETKLANARHDAEAHSISMDTRCQLRSRNPQTAVLGPLTDKKIAKYESAGFYSQSFRDARREMWQRRAAKKSAKRDGNWLIFTDGQKVYSPR